MAWARSRITHALWVLVFLSSASGCLPTAATVPDGPGSGILFVGNSLTYWNDLPLIVQALFDTAGGTRYDVTSVAEPDFSLEDHWLASTARQQIERGGWRIVVLQQGPSSLPESRILLLDYVARFADRITTVGARTALYSVWPSQSRQADFERAIESYRLAANEVAGLFFPAAEAWLATWRRDPAAALYSADGLHPSVAGSYLAALVMYAVLADKTPIGLPLQLRLRDGRTMSVPPALGGVLQAAAAEVTGKA